MFTLFRIKKINKTGNLFNVIESHITYFRVNGVILRISNGAIKQVRAEDLPRIPRCSGI